ncbi:TetR/AcrR family transcriptional regulator C-terminal domain-containing protein [Kribbella sp. NPDC055071]
MKLTREVIAKAALGLLNEVGLDGLTMRLLANELGVQAPALYWHLKNKQELLDAMAAVMSHEVNDGLEAPRKGIDWTEWLTGRARALRQMMLTYRDGARVFAGSYMDESDLPRSVELTLATLVDAGFTLEDAARGFPVVYHYTIGFTIEEQARTGADYKGENPYTSTPLTTSTRYPLTTQAGPHLFESRTDQAFEAGLQVILTGLKATYLPTS